MATTIPATSADILAAQAQAGQAGVQAYQTAKDNLAKQKQDAIAQAIADAQSRGAPDAAFGALQQQIGSPYDARIADLESQGASFGGAMSARDRRMADYNASVQAARGLIGEQVNLATAPINAEANFKVRMLGQQGQNEVDRINAQFRLDQARLEAAAAAALARAGGGGGGGRGGGGGGGGGGGSHKKENLGTLSQTELRESARQGAQARLRAAANKAQGMADVNDRTVERRARQAQVQKSVQNQAWARAHPGASRGNVEAARQAASYTNAAITQWTAQQAAKLRAQNAARQAMVGRTPMVGPPAPVTTYRQMVGENIAEPLAQQLSRTATTVQGQRQLGPYYQRPIAPAPGIDTAAIRRALAQVTNRYTSLGAGGGAAAKAQRDIEQRVNQQFGLSALARQPSISGNQMAALADDRNAELFDLMNSAGPLRGGGTEINERLLGVPDRYGLINPTANAAMQKAMELAAYDLQDMGYNIKDAEIPAAIGSGYKVGDTYADLEQRSLGLGNIRSQQDAYIAEQRRLAAEASGQASADRAAAGAARAEANYNQSNVDREDAQAMEDDWNQLALTTGVNRGALPVKNPSVYLEVVNQGETNGYNEGTRMLAENPPASDAEFDDMMDELGLDPTDETHRLVLSLLRAQAGLVNVPGLASG